MTGGDFGLQGVGTHGGPETFGPVKRRQAATDEELIPTRAILIEQQNGFPARADARVQPRRLDFHEGDQTVDFGFPRHQFSQDPPQTQGFLAQLRSHPVAAGGRGVPLVEDEIDDLEHRRYPSCQLGAARDFERDAGGRQGPLRPNDTLGDRRRGNEEGAGDLLGREPAEQSQRERHAGFGRQHGVAGDEHEAQQVVTDRIVQRRIELWDGLLLKIQQVVANLLVFLRQPLGPAQLIDGATLRRGHEPGSGVVRDPGLGPGLERGDKCLLGQVFCLPHVADHPGEPGDELGGLDAPDRVDGPMCIGRRHRSASAGASYS